MLGHLVGMGLPVHSGTTVWTKTVAPQTGNSLPATCPGLVQGVWLYAVAQKRIVSSIISICRNTFQI